MDPRKVAKRSTVANRACFTWLLLLLPTIISCTTLSGYSGSVSQHMPELAKIPEKVYKVTASCFKVHKLNKAADRHKYSTQYQLHPGKIATSRAGAA